VKVFLNGRILPASRARVSVFDHGFLYGDGIYETVRVYNGQVFHWPDHYKRLKASARRIALLCPWSAAYLDRAIRQTVQANHKEEASVRITVARGPGALGLDPRLSPRPTLAMMLHPERPLEKLQRDGVSIMIPRVRRNHPACLDPQIKSNNSLNTILARMEADKAGAFEAVLLNLDGYLTEGTTTNIFLVKGRKIHTPALSCGLLEGVTRAEVIRLARRAGFKVTEGRFTPRDLRRADEIFLTSTTLEIAPVVRVLQQWRKHPGPVTRSLQMAWYNPRHKSFRKV